MRFNAEIIKNLNIDSESKKFLIEGGLPKSASPFLEFEVLNGEDIPTVPKIWGVGEKYRIYKFIGSNGSGDPICINEKSGNIVYLNHDYDFKEVFINSSIPKLAESLLVFAQLVDETMKENGEEAFLDNNIPIRLRKWIANEIKRIDEKQLIKIVSGKLNCKTLKNERNRSVYGQSEHIEKITSDMESRSRKSGEFVSRVGCAIYHI